MDRLRLERLKSINVILWVLLILAAVATLKAGTDILNASSGWTQASDTITQALWAVFWSRLDTCIILTLSIATISGVIRSFRAVEAELSEKVEKSEEPKPTAAQLTKLEIRHEGKYFCVYRLSDGYKLMTLHGYDEALREAVRLERDVLIAELMADSKHQG